MPFIAKSAAPTASPAAAHWTFDRAAAGGLTLFTAPPRSGAMAARRTGSGSGLRIVTRARYCSPSWPQSSTGTLGSTCRLSS
jgi:hypothetical protein